MRADDLSKPGRASSSGPVGVDGAALALVGAERRGTPVGGAGPLPAGRTAEFLSGFKLDDGSPARAHTFTEWVRRMGALGPLAAVALLASCASNSGPSASVPGSAFGSGARPASVGQHFRATRGLDDPARGQHYLSLLQSRGFSVQLRPGQAVIVGLRTSTSTEANRGAGVYDDGFALLRCAADGTVSVGEYVGNTEPAGLCRGRYGVDVDGDGDRDLGSLLPGHLRMGFSTSDGLGEVLRPTQAAPVARDVRGDGSFVGGGRWSAGRSILFHCGAEDSTSSAGCQTLPPDQWQKFWADLTRGGRPTRIDYYLLPGA